MCPGRPVEHARFDRVHQPFRFALRGDEVIPASRDEAPRTQLQNTIGERIPLVVVKEQPAIQFLLSNCFLDFL